jgi:iron complex outermembrane receptor protein
MTGAVSQVASKDLNKGVYTSPAQLLQGKIAGLLVVGASGAPGAETSIQIRGVSSMSIGTAPLIVVDGIQLDNQSGKFGFTLPGGLGNAPGIDPFSFLNPSDIDRIDVLKDASALAIYGSRGANGVIMITTKKASEGTVKIDFSASAGVSTISKKLKVLNGDQYKRALDSEGGEPALDFGDNVNAFDKIIQTGSIQNYNIGLSAGNHGNNHRLSIGYTDQKGIIKKSGMKKYNALLKSNYNFLDDRIKFDVLLMGAHIEQESAPIGNTSSTAGNIISQSLQWNPTKPLYNIDGSFNQPNSSSEINPLAMLAAVDNNFDMNRIIASVAPTVNLAKGLDYRVQIAIDHAESDWNVTQKKLLVVNGVPGPGPGNLGYSHVGITNQQFSHTLSYTKDFDRLEFTVYVGYEYQRNRVTGTILSAQNFSTDDIDFSHNIDNAPAADVHVSSVASPDAKLQSVFGRFQFNYDDRVKLTATLRNDGSSKFSPKYRNALFPAVAIAWSLDKQGFIPESINELKLRLSWGRNGNQNFPTGLSGKSYAFGQGGGSNTIGVAEFGSPDLRWETSETVNVGVDFGLFNSKVTGTLDVYNKKTNDLLFYLDAAQPFVGAKIWSNIKDAYIVNKGIELGLNTYLLEKDKMTLQLGLNMTYRTITFEPKGGARQLDIQTGLLNGNGLTDQVTQKSVVGESVNEWFMPVFTGFNESGIATYKPTNPKTGDGNYLVGSPYPNLLGGITVNFTYGNFDATLGMNGSAGNKIYNNTANALFVKGNLVSGRNISPDLVGNGEAVGNKLTYSTRYLESGNFIRLSNLSAGYTLKFDSKIMKSLRVYLTAQNLFVITKYTGFDPEVNTNKSVSNVASFGVDYTQYPRARTFVAGITASF